MEYKKRVKELKEKKTDAEKKLKRKQIEQKAQQKVRCKKSKVLAELKRDHPEAAEQISKLDVHHGELGRPSKVYDTVRSLDGLKCELEKRGLSSAKNNLILQTTS